MAELTPMMKQYKSIKKKYQDSILFYRLGDFYEMFFEDAEIAARILDLALTARNKGGGEKAAMAGVPYHSADTYIAKLIKNGYKVAICEQIEDPDEASGIVERDVIRVITPGTVIENDMLEDKNNNFLAAAVYYEDTIGFSYIDISTGDFYVTELFKTQSSKLWDEIDRIRPAEIIVEEDLADGEFLNNYQQVNKILINKREIFNLKKSYEILQKHFKIQSLIGFGIEDMPAAIAAAGEILHFINNTQKRSLKHLDKISLYTLNNYMVLDTATRKNLELTSTIRSHRKNGSLLDVLDKTVTSMGGRLIRKWINQPLINKEEIDRRLEAVEELKDNFIFLQKLRDALDGVYDLERILTKVTYGSANARDLTALRYSLTKLPFIFEALSLFEDSHLLSGLCDEIDTLDDLGELLTKALVEEPPTTVREGGIIEKGFNEELDQLRTMCGEGKDWITNLQKSERERTGISSLKVGFNKVFGYYLEVTKANLDKVPDDYTRKQTLANSERYITPELKEKEAMILGAEDKINDLEYRLFVSVRDKVADNIQRIKKSAGIIATADVLSSFALSAIENDYVSPIINDSNEINIEQGRHPVVEKMLNENFVPNDTILDNEENRFLIITGPNMSGKSTYMRQVALIVLMAQIGSFVPASKAVIGLVDRIFTRVGASDDLTTGQSTFMVEMNEVANIVNNASQKSLIILDEVGRGTSTYDGLSIAWAVSQYINDPREIGARSLFATHYHELTRLEEEFNGIKNYSVLVEEDNSGVHFLHKIVQGKANESYGIEVARLAGLPDELINNARQILKQLEQNDNEIKEVAVSGEDLTETNLNKENMVISNNTVQEIDRKQLSLFESNKLICEKIKEKEIINLTPLEALNFLYELQQEVKEINDQN
ncbi:DNA mismatch repair protein MutS [Iocasia frigidifontis]|uniref:DNA mismatch repair protein MutS n=1 Tax=Iocasia fonsfrigidae TaxID=2682810 RepID=A0A8A7KDX4_9FIRM|nr:DNA mismatch repair protein MutS [Iocasia fonsfrigidae]QTL98305.1 DNA mismatch repair protein MutS [Iocasia fonsfrigidae]